MPDFEVPPSVAAVIDNPEIPRQVRVRPCQHCNVPIMFVPNRSGKPVCLEAEPDNKDGTYQLDSAGNAVMIGRRQDDGQISMFVMDVTQQNRQRYVCHTEKHPELGRRS